MNDMILGFERLDHLVAVSAIKEYVKRSNFLIPECTIEVHFSDYVKSQVHLNVSADLYNRPLSIYVNSLRYLEKKKAKYAECAQEVLRYFYNDLAQFLINNTNNVVLHPKVDCDFSLEKHRYSLDEVKKELLKMFQERSLETLQCSEFSEIIDYIEGVRFPGNTDSLESEVDDGSGICNEVTRKLDSYAVASILLIESKSERLSIVEIV